MTGMEILAVLSRWGVILTIVGFIYKVYRTTTSSISNWAERLLSNHITHLQEASERSAEAVATLAQRHQESMDVQREMLMAQKAIVDSIHVISEDFRQHTHDDDLIQRDLLIGVEIIKNNQGAIETSLESIKARQVAYMSKLSAVDTAITTKI